MKKSLTLTIMFDKALEGILGITIKDIAREAGVSIQTVSRALNDKQEIHIDTKNKILKIARELNYSPNIVASSLRLKRTKTLGIIIPDNRDPFYAEILQGATKAAQSAGYQILLTVLTESGANIDEELQALNTLISKRVDGLLIQPEQENLRYLEQLRKCPVPYVLYNRSPKGLDCNYVTHNHESGSFLAADYLFKKGVKQLYYITRPPETTTVKARIEGCYRAAQENGLTKQIITIIECEDTLEESYQTARNLLKNHVPEAIYTWDDIIAIGVVKAARDLGLQIPKDFMLIGYNDLAIAKFIYPGITTVKQHLALIGEKAVEILITKIQNENDRKPEQIILVPELVVRESA